MQPVTIFASPLCPLFLLDCLLYFWKCCHFCLAYQLNVLLVSWPGLVRKKRHAQIWRSSICKQTRQNHESTGSNQVAFCLPKIEKRDRSVEIV